MAAMHERTESVIDVRAAGNTWERRAIRPDDDQVLEHTWDWLGRLPKNVCPVHLPADFPRIANDLARLWLQTSALDQYFEEKEFSPRAGRHGFPPLIKEELRSIHAYSLRSRVAPDGGRVPQRMSLLD
jgi:hypothetical protein